MVQTVLDIWLSLFTQPHYETPKTVGVINIDGLTLSPQQWLKVCCWAAILQMKKLLFLPFPSLFEASRKTLVVEVVPVQLDNSLVHVVRF